MRIKLSSILPMLLLLLCAVPLEVLAQRGQYRTGSRQTYRTPTKPTTTLCDAKIFGKITTSDLQQKLDAASESDQDGQVTLCFAPESQVLLDLDERGNTFSSGLIIRNKTVTIKGSSDGSTYLGNTDHNHGRLIQVLDGGVLNVENVTLFSLASWSNLIHVENGRLNSVKNTNFYLMAYNATGISAQGRVGVVQQSTFYLRDSSDLFHQRSAIGIKLRSGSITALLNNKVYSYGEDTFLITENRSAVGKIDNLLFQGDANPSRFETVRVFFLTDNTNVGTISNVRGNMSGFASRFLHLDGSRVSTLKNIKLNMEGSSIDFASLYASSHINAIANITLATHLTDPYNSDRGLLWTEAGSTIGSETNINVTGNAFWRVGPTIQ